MNPNDAMCQQMQLNKTTITVKQANMLNSTISFPSNTFLGFNFWWNLAYFSKNYLKLIAISIAF